MASNKNKIQTVPQAFKKAVSTYGHRVAIRHKELGLWHDIPWMEYYQRVRWVSAALISMGLKKGTCVSIIGNNCPEWVFASMGIQCVGGVATGVYATNAWPQVEYVVNNSESIFLFVENEEQLDKWLMFRDKVPKLKKVIVWDTEGLRNFKDPMVMTFDELLQIGRETDDARPTLFDTRSIVVY